ncbi:hypothetical protein KJ937_03545 [Patescibacteria group bacterium]|nr:hypothetical protein [Patescibacteria group bacterium]
MRVYLESVARKVLEDPGEPLALDLSGLSQSWRHAINVAMKETVAWDDESSSSGTYHLGKGGRALGFRIVRQAALLRFTLLNEVCADGGVRALDELPKKPARVSGQRTSGATTPPNADVAFR